mgnify:CR=1 FL=1
MDKDVKSFIDSLNKFSNKFIDNLNKFIDIDNLNYYKNYLTANGAVKAASINIKKFTIGNQLLS